LQHNQRCKRTQHKINRSGVGSLPTFAALSNDISFKPEASGGTAGQSVISLRLRQGPLLMPAKNGCL